MIDFMNDKPIWEPDSKRIENSNLSCFTYYLSQKYDIYLQSYEKLYQWSIDNIAKFWEALFEYTDIIHSTPFDTVLEGDDIKTAKWFSGLRLNFAENLLRYKDDHTAIIYQNEDLKTQRVSYKELYEQVASCAEGLKKLGVNKNDRVAAYITNSPEAIIGMLATASIGAVWTSCSPDFGFQGVLDRFQQVKPKVLLSVNGYSYNGKRFDKLDTILKLAESINDIKKIVIIDKIDDIAIPNDDLYMTWVELLNNKSSGSTFEQVGFDHPLYIMYSSGTTGKPKCIVHGAGGTLLQHLKELVLHTDLKRNDVITYFTTCGWMMWNWMVSSLAVGAAIYLYDGSPSYPSLNVLFKAIENEKITVFGTSPKFLSSCETSGLVPKDKFDLCSLKIILSTGSPLTKQNFEFVYRDIKKNVQLSSISGGTDIISCFMLGNPILPVYNGELQCRGLGMKVETFDDNGHSVINEVGELVCTAPFPSRPIYFLNDNNGSKYHDAYFNRYPGVWHHGDFIKINSHGGVIVYGRSDATLNPGGVRIGTAEIYGPVEAMKEINDSIVVASDNSIDTEIILFVVLNEGFELTDELHKKIKDRLKQMQSPRHVPSKIYQVSDIPRTLNGKKVELAVAKIINGEYIDNKEALANPEILKEFSKFRPYHEQTAD